jgi:hypothetical protein
MVVVGDECVATIDGFGCHMAEQNEQSAAKSAN